MRTLLENMLRSLVRFKAATLLNVIGMSVALASFMIIMMQVYQELTFDTCYSTSGSLYRVELDWFPGRAYNPTLSRPGAEEIFSASPYIRKGAFYRYNGALMAYDPSRGTSTATEENTIKASNDFSEVFGLEIIAGSSAQFNLGDKAILAASTAERIFGDEDPIGRALICSDWLQNDTVEVVAVYRDLPRNCSLDNSIILNLGQENRENWEDFNYLTFLLIDDPEQVASVAELASAKLSMHMSGDEKQAGRHVVKLTHLPDRYFSPWNADHRKGNRTALYSLIAVATLIMLIAIINFINFSMALVPRRIRNINTRKVFGGGVWGLRLQQFYEALGLNLIALGLGLCIVHMLAGSALSSMFNADIHLDANLSICWLALGIAVLTSLLASIYPAIYSTSFPTAMVIQGSFGLSIQGRRLRTVLIGLQYVISLVLIIVALAIWKQYNYMRSYDIGLSRENILVTNLTYNMAEHQEVLTDRLKKNPNVVDVAYSLGPVTDPAMSWTHPHDHETIFFHCIPVSYNFPSLMGIQIVEGRDFLPSDNDKNGTFIFNQKAQSHYNLRVGEFVENHNNQPHEAEIVGVAKDFNFMPLHYPIGEIALMVFGHNPWGPLNVCYIKVKGPNVLKTLDDVRKTMLAFDPEAQSRLKLDFFDESIGNMYKKESRQAAQVTLFSLLAVLISTLGAFGLILFETQYRRKEIALRKTYGATIGNILYMFNRRYGIIVLICFVLAAPTAYLIIRHWQQNFAYQAPIGVWIFVVALCIVLLITVGTVTLQSYRSATENPSHSFKQE